LKLKQTSDYTTTPIPYVPFYSMEGGMQVPVTIDDTWATPVTDLPFNFNFYAGMYSKVLVGTNGILSFNVSPSNVGGGIPGGTEIANEVGGCSWAFSQQLDSSSPGFPE